VSATDLLRHEKRQLVRQYAQSTNGAGLWQVLTTLLPLGAVGWLTVIVSRQMPWLALPLTLVAVVLFIRVFALLHECGHGSLFRTQFLNQGFGFVFGVLSGMPQYVWSQHHDYHHRTNGDWDRYRGPLSTLTLVEYDALSASGRRSYRRARHIGFAPLGGFVYLVFNPRFNWLKGSVTLLLDAARSSWRDRQHSFAQHAALHKSRYWKTPREYRHMLANNAVLLGLWALALTLGAPGLFIAVYLGSLSLAGGIAIALFTVQHNFDHAYARDSAHWDVDASVLEGTSFLILPGWLNWATANIGYHHVHHLSAAIPGYRLVACHEQYRHLFTGVRRIALWEIPRHLKCLLWDRDNGRIVSFAEHDAAQAGRESPARPA
jgi:acyl-lipid omega-6 desaturase (Delta-12 desaturase)